MSWLTWIANRLNGRLIYYQNDKGENVEGLMRFSPVAYVPKKERGWCMYLHRFCSRDFDGHHNHPWAWSVSIVLKGGYTESRVTSHPACHSTRRVRWFNFLRSTDYHRIEELHGETWTLFFCGPLTGKSWGFLMPGRGHVHWETRIAERKLEF